MSQVDEILREEAEVAYASRVKKGTDAKIRETLAALAGKVFQEEDIVHQGTQLVLPEKMSVSKAIKMLQLYEKAQSEMVSFSRTFRFRPYDGAIATVRAMKKITGVAGHGKSSFFTRPQLIDVAVNFGETVQAPWGELSMPLIEGTVYLQFERDEEYGPLFQLVVHAPRMFKMVVDGLFVAIQNELELESIYRGKAFGGQETPEFLDLSAVDPGQVIYNESTEASLVANVWSLLRHSETMRENGVSLKRSVVLHGQYGTGKSLTGFLTALEAVQNEWTFIYCRPARDDLNLVMQTARLYQPAVVFFEDIDTISDPGQGRDDIVKLLDLFDGITAKGTELLVVMTTNHVDKIHKGMMRPGRLDAVIEIPGLDANAVYRLIAAKVPESMLKGIDFTAVGKALDGFLPAFVVETIDQAKRLAISANGGETPEVLLTEHFVLAATAMRSHLELMNDATELVEPDSLSAVFGRIIDDSVANSRQPELDTTAIKRTVGRALRDHAVRDEDREEDLAIVER